MEKPILIIMAAGLGSRFGGLKQIAPVDPFGHILMDYSIFDARRAGFERVIFVINPDLESDFRQAVGERISKYMDVRYAYQRITDLPDGFSVPKGRTKPWGTAHAVRSAKDMVFGPFAVINADDYYGDSAYKLIYDFLSSRQDDTCHAMVGYNIENTLTENGYVSRGICQMDSNGFLQKIVERTHVEIRPGGAAFTENGTDFTFIPEKTTISMNLWGFSHSMMEEIDARFVPFLKDNLPQNPLKCEYFLPFVPDALIHEGRARVKVLTTPDKWYGVTYAADMPEVAAALSAMKRDGKYPLKLWED